MGVSAGPHYIDDTLTFTAITHRFDTGALTDADAVPAYRIYEDETGTAILTGNTAKLDDANTTGFYSEQITLSAANGFEVGKSYSIYVSAAVNSVTGGQTFNFKVIATPSAAPSAAAIADAVWDEDATGHQTQGSFGQVLGDSGSDSDTLWALANTNLDAAVSSRMATYTQPTGFLAATFPGTVASTTNITAAAGITLADGAITAAKIADGAIDAATFAAGAIDAAALAADAGTEIATAVWASGTRSLTVLDEDSTTLDLDTTIRAAVGLASANLDTQIDALPTNSELATALGTADDAVLAAIAALNNLSAAQVNTEVDTALADINLDHLVKIAVDTDFPTTVHLGSVIGQLADNGTTATFDRTTDSLEAIRDRGDAAWITATGFSTHSAADVWTSGTRVLTAGTNIVLAKGSGVTGFNDLSAAQVNTEADTALADYDGPTHAELTAGLAAADDATLAQIALVKSVTDKVDDTLEDDGGTFRFTTNALEEAPTGGAAPTVAEIADEVQTRTIAAVTTVNGLGANSVTAAALAADAGTEIGTAVWASATRLLTAGTNIALAKGSGITGFNDLDAAGVRGAVGLGAANLDTQLDALPSNAELAAELATALAAADDAVLAALATVSAKTNLIPASPAAIGDAMTLTSAYDFAKGTAAMVEAYAANGVAPTPIQALYAIHQMLTMFGISGTNLTVKKLDNATTAFIVTLNDDTNPTGAART